MLIYARMCIRLLSFYKIFGTLFILVLIYNEHLVYKFNSWTWKKLECKNETNCLKVLLVADPQLIGEENEIIHSITPVSIWDSDRFLRKTYSLAVDHFSPEVIIFLGDLFDEGSTANTAQYERYLKRFFSIFTTEYPIEHIFLPGDNDIGGETDDVTKQKISRFETAFSQPPVLDIKHVRFSKVNRMVKDLPESFNYAMNISSKFPVVVSHMPLILVLDLYLDKVLEVLKPRLIFAAHQHKSKLVISIPQQDYRKIEDLSEKNNKIHEYKLEKDRIYEILVPTCSYRMGTDSIGYGAAIIELNDTLQYTIFWLPERFYYVGLYVFLVSSTLICYVLSYFFKKLFKPRVTPIKKQHYPYKIIENSN